MRIAFFSKQLPSDAPNGVSVQVDRLANALTKLGHTVTCFSFSSKPASAVYSHVQLARGSASRLAQKFLPALAFSKIDTREFDIVHYHGDDYLCPGDSRRIRTFYGSAFFEALHAGRAGRFFYQAFFYLLEWLSCLRRGKRAAISRATLRALPLVKHVIPSTGTRRERPGRNQPLPRYCS
jgi:glycosyltransferase involved in cell wall biosynthesis